MTVPERLRTLPRRFASLMRRRGGLLMAALICSLLGYVVYESFGFTAEARRAPLIVAIPAGLAAFLLVIKEIISPTEPASDEESAELPAPAAVKEEVQDAAQEATDRRDPGPQTEAPVTAERASAGGVSTAAAVGWVLVLTVMFLLLGLLVTIPLFTVVFMRVYGRERWRTILLTAAVVFGMVYVFFVQVLGVRVFGGWVGEWLGLF